MARYDLLAIDMDGTLLDPEKKISPLNHEALSAAAEAGCRIVVATGRCLSEVAPYLDQMPFVRYVIAVCGAAVYDLREDKTLIMNKLPASVLKMIVREAEGYDAMVQLMGDRSYLPKSALEKVDRCNMSQYRDIYEKYAVFCDELPLADVPGAPNVYAVNMFFSDTADRDRVKEKLDALDLEVMHAERSGLECSLPGHSKGTALKQLCDQLSIPLERAVAFGDAENDIGMLRAAGLGVAMGNAVAAARSAADVVTDDCAHSGCGKAILKYVL